MPALLHLQSPRCTLRLCQTESQIPDIYVHFTVCILEH